MKVRYINSATVIIESSNGVKILTDPWFTDGEYYGAWYNFPPFEFEESFFEDLDFIYVSHIHPDHFSKKTFQKLSKNIPVLIHLYENKFLKKNIEVLGFKVIELSHNIRTHLKNNVFINILAADNCNPKLCGKFFGCGIVESKFGSTQIDTICVIDDITHVVVNTNDCPFELSKDTLHLVKSQYQKVDLLLVGYGGAGPYPQCFNLDNEEKQNAASNKCVDFLNIGVKYIDELNPIFVLPFAGTYVLGGKLSKLQKYRGVPEIEDAASYFEDNSDAKIILLNRYEYFDIPSKTSSKKYIPVNLEEKQSYITNVLSKKKLDYENDENEETYFKKNKNEILNLIFLGYNRFENKRIEIGFYSDTSTLIYLTDNLWCEISNKGEGISLIDTLEKIKVMNFVSYRLDIRLLHRILKGPKHSHWNNAEIGSHIEFDRCPNDFNRGLYHCMNFFHS